MTLRMLPPGGGGDEPPDGPSDRAIARVGTTQELFDLTEMMTIPERQFSETFVVSGSLREALYAAEPNYLNKTDGAQCRRIVQYADAPLVRRYIELAKGTAALSSGLSWRATVMTLAAEGEKETNPPYVKVLALTAVAKELRGAGMAAREAAIEGVEGKEKDGKRGAGAVPKKVADLWVEQLSSSPPVPKISGGDGG